MTLIDSMTDAISLLVVLSHVFIAAAMAVYAYTRFTKGNLLSALAMPTRFIRRHGILLAWIVALASTLLSLFYSEFAQYTPCTLCWYQRIAMYPLVIILAIAMLRRDKAVNRYVFPLAIIGGLIAAYQAIAQYIPSLAPCAANAIGCTTRYVFAYGYITIPLMSLTGFVLIAIFLMAQGDANG